MRVTEPLVRAGYFWLPGKPKKRLPGTLRITNSGRIDLEVLGHFGGANELFGVPRVVGIVEDDGAVTLDKCIGGRATLGLGGVSKSSYLVHFAFLGVAYGEGVPVLLDKFYFSVEGLDDWLRLSGLKVTGMTGSKISIDYSNPDPVMLDLGGGRTVSFVHTWNMSTGLTENHLRQKAHILLETETPLPFEDFTRITNRIANFLCFAIDKTLSIDEASTVVTADEVDGKSEQRTEVKIYYQSLPYAEQPPKDTHDMLFGYERIRNSAQERLQKWLAAYEIFQPALSLYFASRAGAHKYLNGRFLSVIQGLETYHRRTRNERHLDDAVYREFVSALRGACPAEHRELLGRITQYGNELSLATRLKAIIEPFKERLGDAKTRKRLVRSIVETRNYLTHYDEALRDRAAEGPDLLRLCLVGEAILQLHFLKEVGFTDKDVGQIIANSRSLKSKLEGKPFGPLVDAEV